MKRQQKGFTLVEIAIVLVIIGLLLGGILKGQEMITQAKIKNVVADFSGISAAYYGYQDRYRALPGDDLNAATRWATPTAATNGNGDGVVAGGYNGNAGSGAPAACARDRRSVQLVGSPETRRLRRGFGVQQPFNSVTGLLGVQTGLPGATPPTALGGFSGLIVCSANLPDKISIAVDTQMDDGSPATGTVRGQAQTSPNPAVAATAATAYAETGTNVYVLCRSL